MRRTAVAAVVLMGTLAVAASGWAQPEPSPPALEADAQARLEAGEVLVETSRGEVIEAQVVGLVDAPPEQVWAVISDFGSQSAWVPEMSVSEVLREEGEAIVGRSGNAMPWPIADREFELRIVNGPWEVDGVSGYASRYRHVAGSGNVDSLEGYWLVLPWGDGTRTLVWHAFRVDMGISIPRGMMAWGTRRMLPDILAALRARVAQR